MIALALVYLALLVFYVHSRNNDDEALRNVTLVFAAIFTFGVVTIGAVNLYYFGEFFL